MVIDVLAMILAVIWTGCISCVLECDHLQSQVLAGFRSDQRKSV